MSQGLKEGETFLRENWKGTYRLVLRDKRRRLITHTKWTKATRRSTQLQRIEAQRSRGKRPSLKKETLSKTVIGKSFTMPDRQVIQYVTTTRTKPKRHTQMAIDADVYLVTRQGDIFVGRFTGYSNKGETNADAKESAQKMLMRKAHEQSPLILPDPYKRDQYKFTNEVYYYVAFVPESV